MAKIQIHIADSKVKQMEEKIKARLDEESLNGRLEDGVHDIKINCYYYLEQELNEHANKIFDRIVEENIDKIPDKFTKKEAKRCINA